MSITSRTLLYLLFGGAVLVPVGIVLAWSRVRGPGWLRTTQRLTAVVLAQVLLTAGVLAYVNDANSLYPSWSDLFPQHTDLAAARPDPVGAIGGVGDGYRPRVGAAGYVRANPRDLQDPRPAPKGFEPFYQGYSTVLDGARSGVRAPVYVWLPPEYFLPADAHVRFPVVEMLGGYPGTPRAWLRHYHLPEHYAAAVARGAHPFIFVMPTINVAGSTDLECSDIPGHPAVGTFLTTDVPAMVERDFRTLREPSAWGAMGYSEGGFCALKLATLDPARFGAAVSMSGYGYPTSHEFGADRVLRASDSPDVALAGPFPPPVDLLLTASTADPGDYKAFQETVAAVRPPTRVYELTVPRGGHVDKVWIPLMTPAFQWLSAHLRPPSHAKPGLPPPRLVARRI